MGKDELVDTKKVKSQVPSWLGETKTKKEFLRFLMRDALMKAEYYHTLMKPFGHKYAETYPELKKKVELSENEATGEHALYGTHQAATWRLSRVSGNASTTFADAESEISQSVGEFLFRHDRYSSTQLHIKRYAPI